MVQETWRDLVQMDVEVQQGAAPVAAALWRLSAADLQEL